MGEEIRLGENVIDRDSGEVVAKVLVPEGFELKRGEAVYAMSKEAIDRRVRELVEASLKASAIIERAILGPVVSLEHHEAELAEQRKRCTELLHDAAVGQEAALAEERKRCTDVCYAYREPKVGDEIPPWAVQMIDQAKTAERARCLTIVSDIDASEPETMRKTMYQMIAGDRR